MGMTPHTSTTVDFDAGEYYRELLEGGTVQKPKERGQTGNYLGK